ncbi:hypothetical protein ACKKBG_A02570 [Auxenochlorella protothecoides x Auxenochlorella symbiontica]
MPSQHLRDEESGLLQSLQNGSSTASGTWLTHRMQHAPENSLDRTPDDSRLLGAMQGMGLASDGGAGAKPSPEMEYLSGVVARGVAVAVEGTVEHAMSAAVHTAIEDQNIHFDVKANLGTLVAVTGVILFWRGVWNMWCEGWVGIDGMSVRVGEGGGSTPFAGAGARELPPLDPRTPVRRPCSPFLSPWPLQGHGDWPLAHQRPAVHGHRLGHHALHPLLPGAPGADVPGDVNTFGVAWARWRCAPVHLPLLRGTSMV